MTPFKSAYKYPFIASEILSCNNTHISNSLLSNSEAILNLFKVLDNKEILKTTIPGYIHKIILTHVNNKLFLVKILEFKDKIFEILLKFIYSDNYRDILYLILNEGVKQGKDEYKNIILNKLWEVLITDIKNFIDKKDLTQAKIEINNISWIILKISQNNEEIFSLISKKIIESEFIKNIMNENEENKNILETFYCQRKIIIFCTNLLYILFYDKLKETEKEEDIDKNLFNKYYLTTIIEPSYITLINSVDVKPSENVEMKDAVDKKNIDLNEETLLNSIISYLINVYLNYENKIETLHNINKTLIIGFYNEITDMLILLLLLFDNKINISNLLDEILVDLIHIIIDYPYCSIIHNKILEIFVLLNEKYQNFPQKEQIIKNIINYYTESKLRHLISDTGIIKNDRKESFNNIYLVKILNLLKKQENKKMVDYLNVCSKGLLENEKMDSKDYVPTPDQEEIIFQKKTDIYDTEAFMFTPKKSYEDNKKIMKNLKAMDEVK